MMHITTFARNRTRISKRRHYCLVYSIECKPPTPLHPHVQSIHFAIQAPESECSRLGRPNQYDLWFLIRKSVYDSANNQFAKQERNSIFGAEPYEIVRDGKKTEEDVSIAIDGLDMYAGNKGLSCL
ncbi:unnamed protein product [Albugo candida]|uniref:Uncharacterized protein n=1 Tax=Albugo candida TaxID=65357 RepID=A0A024FVN6_9STRA|nr:unnamed protein product [Albugo candida]|eukprot:CCI10962.1 unnamed protein product [Albugo candida]